MSSSEDILKLISEVQKQNSEVQRQNAEGQRRNSEAYDRLVLEVSKLTESVQKLVVIDSAREVREKQQQDVNTKQAEVNKEFRTSIGSMKPTIDRVVNWHQLVDKIKVPIIAAIVFGLATVLGFDWGK